MAGVRFSLKELDSYQVAKYAIKKLFHRKTIIVPGVMIKLGIFCTRLATRKLVTRVTHMIQHRKKK